MNKLIQILIAMTCLISSCTTSKPLQSQKSDVNSSDESIGHIKMRLVEYEIIDTAEMNEEMAKMMVEMMKPSLETELVFNSTRSVELVKENDVFIRSSMYDRSMKTVYEFITSDSMQFYTEWKVSEMMSDGNATDEELEELSKMIQVTRYPQSASEIFGFECNEVVMMAPPDYSEVYTIIYTTSRIPHISEAMEPMSSFFTGAPLKTIMFVNGLKITFGAVEFSKNKSMEKYLSLEDSKLHKVSQDEFESMKDY